jgi:hypothetical protein
MAKRRSGKRTRTQPSADGKLSDHLLELARPLLEGVGREPTADDAQKILRIAITIWNTAVLERWGATPELVARTRATLDALPPTLAPLVARLFARKAEHWPDDLRAVGNWEIIRNPDGDWGLRVDAYDRPPTDA